MTQLEQARKAKGLSQRALGRLAKVDASYICNAEKHGFGYGIRLQKIAEALDWEGEPSELLEDAPEVVTQ